MAEDLIKIPAEQKLVKVPGESHTLSDIPPVLELLSTKTSEQGVSNKNSTRQGLAYLYVGAFLTIIMLTLVGMFLRNYSIDNIKDVLLTESGILSGPLGFIIGFYFKEELEKKSQ
jgi:hypothetical protein